MEHGKGVKNDQDFYFLLVRELVCTFNCQKTSWKQCDYSKGISRLQFKIIPDNQSYQQTFNASRWIYGINLIEIDFKIARTANNR